MSILDLLKKKINLDIEELSKIEGDPNAFAENAEHLQTDPNNQIGRKAQIADPYFDTYQVGTIYKAKLSRITNKTLKDVSVRDWLISAIIQARVDTMMQFGRPQRKLFETGFKFIKRDNNAGELSDKDRQSIADLEELIYNCGRTDKLAHGDRMLFPEFLKLLTRDAITFGHIAVEKVLTRKGAVHRIRPLPAETLYRINPNATREHVEQETKNARMTRQHRLELRADMDPTLKQQHNNPEIEYYKYVQMSYDNKVLEIFGDEDLIFKVANPQNFMDAMGYCYSALELCIINATAHMNVESYNSNFFTHGYAARGILHLKGTVTQSQLTAFRRQFYNSISGTQNAWRTPIIAGMDEVEWIPMSASAREMEYLNYDSHLMRSICTQFQIDPIELGLDYLGATTNRSQGNQAGNEYKINFSRERGLIPILMMFEDLINGEVIPAFDPELAKTFEFKFVGYTDETPQTHIALQQAEMTVHSSMNDLLSSSGKKAINEPIASVPLNQQFWALVEKNMTRGEIREHFFGDEGASKRRELQYIPGDPAFLQWNSFLMTIESQKQQMEAQQQQVEAQQQQQAQEQDLAQKEHQREQEKHELETNEMKSRHAAAAVNPTKSLHDIAKESGASGSHVVGGVRLKNPLNQE